MPPLSYLNIEIRRVGDRLGGFWCKVIPSSIGKWSKNGRLQGEMVRFRAEWRNGAGRAGEIWQRA